MDYDDAISDIDQNAPIEPTCPRCGLRSYDITCAQCDTPIISKKDDEDEDYNWREHKR